MRSFFLYIISLALLLSCNQKEQKKKEYGDPTRFRIFEKVNPKLSGIDFVNYIEESPNLNYYTYKHMYIGGGVATGDFNNDGLDDIYFTANLSPNKLYLNKGDFRFEDITSTAGVEGNTGFYMGVTVIDINNDGWLDIYVCKSGKYQDPRFKQNLLFINNGDLTFTEKAAEYGLNDANQSVQASFFDYDLDGDLDVFVVNTPVDFSISQQAIVLDYIYRNPAFQQYGGNDQLYRNEGNGRFTNVTKQAGILPDLGFGLNVTTSDFNSDGFADIFVANDFIAPDYLYINQGDGTFQEKSKEYLRHTSFYSMGSNSSDINNDGLPDLMVLDMNPADYVRSKTTMEMMNRDLFKKVTDAGYNYIYMHNMLHLNTGMGSFSEISQLAGISNTDWSWSVLAEDFDNDGYKDIHITNGIYRDVLDRDRRAALKEYAPAEDVPIGPEAAFEHLKSFPSEKIPNYMFRNKGGIKFETYSSQWGLDQHTFSNGSAAADFDNDGDLDLVVNNLMDTALMYQNKANEVGLNFIKIVLEGPKNNIDGIGSKIYIETNHGTQFKEAYSTKGYLSASQGMYHFGLGKDEKVSKVTVVWPDGKKTLLQDVAANEQIVAQYASSRRVEGSEPNAEKLFVENTDILLAPYAHSENFSDDYQKQVLLPYKYSHLGPALAVGDVNADGLDDFFVGGATGQASVIFTQLEDGTFSPNYYDDFKKDALYEDIGAVFFDFDQDGDQDLYVASGGYEFDKGDVLLQDRLYENENGIFSVSGKLPPINSVTQSVVPFDYDNDEDLDLFVGGRVIPGDYPLSPQSYLLENEGKKYVDVSGTVGKNIRFIGMVTQAESFDYNSDGWQDLLLVGEWISPTLFLNDEGKGFKLISDVFQKQNGWWQSVKLADLNGDGHDEIIAGNLGLNTKFKAQPDKPLHMYASDFDGNNTTDAFLAKNIGDRQVPVRGKDCTSEQMPVIGERFETFQEFASADINQILGPNFDDALHLEAHTFESGLFFKDEQGFTFEAFPAEAQVSPGMSFEVLDFNGDGLQDIIMAGNIYQMEVETTRLDAGTGTVLINKGDFKFEVLTSKESGFYVPGDVKGIKLLKNTADKKPRFVVGVNDGPLVLFEMAAAQAEGLVLR